MTKLPITLSHAQHIIEKRDETLALIREALEGPRGAGWTAEDRVRQAVKVMNESAA